MQIISGTYKNRQLKSPNDPKTHPMGSREKLALFNMLTPYLENAVVLDAFAGSGALGLEALSRGAQKVVFLEKSPKIAQIIRENLQNIDENLTNYSKIIVKSASSFISDEQFDIIIADPPYDNFQISEIEPLINCLKPSGIFVLSHPKTLNPALKGLKLQKNHQYAAAALAFFQKV